MAGTSSPKRNRRFWIIALILCLLLALSALVVYIIRNPWWVKELDPSQYHHTELDSSENGTTDEETESNGSSRTPTPTDESGRPGGTVETGEPVDPDQTDPEETGTGDPGQTQTGDPSGLRRNPVDFDALAKVNPDIYAWIYVPMKNGKSIDLPVLQSAPDAADDNYYLHHSIYKQYLFSGSIYTQRQNAKDFSDRVTVIYGHNMKNGTKFSNLVLFTYKQVFDANDVFYIYIPGHKLTYKIVAGIEFDKRHILNNFDFSNDQVFADWIQNYILSPKVMVRNVRKGVEVTTDDKLVILSTCLVHNKSRYLIQGVLIKDELTK